MSPLVVRLLPYGIAAVVILGCAWWLYHKGYNDGEADTQSRWDAATKEAGQRFSEALQQQQERLVVANQELARERSRAQTQRGKLDEALRTPEGLAWSDVPLPDGVRLSLRPDHSSVSGDP